MDVRAGDVAILVAVLPFLGVAPLSLAALQGARRLGDGAASASVAEVQTVAAYLEALASHPHMPAEAKRPLLAARDALLGRRVRNHHPRQRGRGTGGGAGGSRGRRVTATVDVAL